MEEGVGGVDGDDHFDGETSGSSGSEVEQYGDLSSSFRSYQWPQSYMQSIDSYTIAASPSFGFFGRAPSIYSSLDLGTQSGHDLNLKTPLLSKSVIGKDGSDKCLKKPSNLTGSAVISSQLHFHGGLTSHGCSVTQTVFNGSFFSRGSFLQSHLIYTVSVR
ncbi:hypothetical protein KSP40_PGU020298 [Platanthera guangdongensis]|uniref:Uncharacterized protein n=1 Tax=Platanthera guangdongensis TaxID=2320717 RepID=A0ABR2MTL6_9ASPA